MSLLINDDLIWISIPKCASVSIETALLHSELDIKLHPEYRYNLEKKNCNNHIQRDILFYEFGIHPTICIKRNWLDRWVSGLEYIWQNSTRNGYSLSVQWEEIDNNFIYNTIDINFAKTLYFRDNFNDNFRKLINNLTVEINENDIPSGFVTLLSQNYWKENKPCTYEFDIKELHKFEEFIQKRYGGSFNLEHLNITPKIKNKIEINDELKNYLWNVFEKPFEKRNQLI
jgi:hypothetical protein